MQIHTSFAGLLFLFLSSFAFVDPTPGVALAAPTSPALPAGLEPGTYVIDPGHSHIGFQVEHLGVSWAFGRFDSFSGEVLIAEKAGDSSVFVSVESKSLDTGESDRDKHLRSPDFFDCVNYPELGFESIEVQRREGGSFHILGKLSLHGVTKEVALDMELVGAGERGPRFGYRAGVYGELVIDRTDFGMTTYAKEGGIGKECRLRLSFELRRQG